jgi:hypothetical protein|tara:strand:+ start:1013 stop:1126 length:114 start_codon:yes stop_codon:yes gene_type:complete
MKLGLNEDGSQSLGKFEGKKVVVTVFPQAGKAGSALK